MREKIRLGEPYLSCYLTLRAGLDAATLEARVWEAALRAFAPVLAARYGSGGKLNLDEQGTLLPVSDEDITDP